MTSLWLFIKVEMWVFWLTMTFTDCINAACEWRRRRRAMRLGFRLLKVFCLTQKSKLNHCHRNGSVLWNEDSLLLARLSQVCLYSARCISNAISCCLRKSVEFPFQKKIHQHTVSNQRQEAGMSCMIVMLCPENHNMSHWNLCLGWKCTQRQHEDKIESIAGTVFIGIKCVIPCP